MNNVIEVSHENWYTLVQLRDSMKYMKQKDQQKYKTAIDKEKDIHDYILKDILSN